MVHKVSIVVIQEAHLCAQRALNRLVLIARGVVPKNSRK